MLFLTSLSIITSYIAITTAAPIPNAQTFVVPPEDLAPPPIPATVPVQSAPAPVFPTQIAPVAPQGWSQPPWPNNKPASTVTLGPTRPQPQIPPSPPKQEQADKPYIENDKNNGFTIHGPLGTYHKGPDGTYIKGGLGTIDAQKGAPTYYQSGLGTVVSGQGVWKYDPTNKNGPYGGGNNQSQDKSGGRSNIVRNILSFMGIAKETND